MRYETLLLPSVSQNKIMTGNSASDVNCLRAATNERCGESHPSFHSPPLLLLLLYPLHLCGAVRRSRFRKWSKAARPHPLARPRRRRRRAAGAVAATVTAAAESSRDPESTRRRRRNLFLDRVEGAFISSFHKLRRGFRMGHSNHDL